MGMDIEGTKEMALWFGVLLVFSRPGRHIDDRYRLADSIFKHPLDRRPSQLQLIALYIRKQYGERWRRATGK